MIEWLVGLVPLLKGVHIAALILWTGGLLCLPLLLARHDPAVTQEDYRRIRRATHLTYTACVTPAAIVTIVAGTWLVFLRDVFVPWLYLKLLFVAALAGAHAWIGHLIVQVAEEPGQRRAPSRYLGLVAVPVLVILVLVLGKPELGWIAFPDWLLAPRDGQWPFDVPSR